MKRKESKFEAAAGNKGMTLDRKLRGEIFVLNEAINVLKEIIAKKEHTRKKLRNGFMK